MQARTRFALRRGLLPALFIPHMISTALATAMGGRESAALPGIVYTFGGRL